MDRLTSKQTPAGTLTYTTTAAQDAQIADFVARDNRGTLQAQFDELVSNWIASKYGQAVNQAITTGINNSWPTLGASRKTAICTQLQVDPCPP